MSKEIKRSLFVGGIFIVLSIVCAVTATYFPMAVGMFLMPALVFAFSGGAYIWFQGGKDEKIGEFIEFNDLKPGKYRIIHACYYEGGGRPIMLLMEESDSDNKNAKSKLVGELPDLFTKDFDIPKYLNVVYVPEGKTSAFNTIK